MVAATLLRRQVTEELTCEGWKDGKTELRFLDAAVEPLN